jgi:hypothetical protein
MGLDTTHNAWHGSYGRFGEWRRIIAGLSGIPLELMDGFYTPLANPSDPIVPPTLYHGIRTRTDPEWSLLRVDEYLPIDWELLKPSALHHLLNHSDYNGEIAWEVCNDIADELEKLLPRLQELDANWVPRTQQFIDGLRLAYNQKENLEFN